MPACVLAWTMSAPVATAFAVVRTIADVEIFAAAAVTKSQSHKVIFYFLPPARINNVYSI